MLLDISDLNHIITVSRALSTNLLLALGLLSLEVDEMWNPHCGYCTMRCGCSHQYSIITGELYQDSELESCVTSIDEIVPMIYTSLCDNICFCKIVATNNCN